MTFDFVSAGRIVFGPGRAREAGPLARGLVGAAPAPCILLIRGRSAGADVVKGSLDAAGVEVAEMPGPGGEPDETDIDHAVPLARDFRPAAVVAVGGGSVLDFAKAVAALAPQAEAAPVREHLEGVGTGRTLSAPPLPLIACPTTAGTGSEVTKNAVVSSRAGRFKKSLRDPRMVPAIALVDPELQAGAPARVRAASGLDALTQNVEAFVSRRATPMTDALALRGIAAARHGLDLLAAGDATGAQEPLALAALLSGLALANGGLGAAHGIAQALGIYGVPHGLACAVALPWVMAFNAGGGDETRRRLAAAGRALAPPPPEASDNDSEAVRRAVAWVWETGHALGVPRLDALPERFPDLPRPDDTGLARIAGDARGNSLNGNPVPLGDAEVAALLARMRDDPDPQALLAERLAGTGERTGA